MNKRPLLPDIVRHPAVLLLLCALPQMVLLAVHYQSFRLVEGQLDAAGRGAHMMVFVLLGAAALTWTAAGMLLAGMKRKAGPLLAAGIFTAGFAYLWTFLRIYGELIPPSIADWMLSDGEMLYNHMALVAPSLFYGLILLAGTPLNIGSVKDISASMLTVISIPLAWYLVLYSGITYRWEMEFPEWALVLLLFTMTAVMLLAFLRVMLFLHAKIGSRVWLPAAASFVFPFAGLLLNRAIPFPVDLQDWRVYTLTALNAAAVCLPFTGGRLSVWIWFARAAAYPFTLYFFLLFLPFLPLAIPAMVAAGGGFLILAPTLLFVIHSRRLMIEGRLVAARIGRIRCVLLFLAALAAMPGGYLIRAELHRRALTAAVDAVYHPDFSLPGADIRLRRADHALNRLDDMKNGSHAPFLSDVYNRIVFDGLVLPDHRMNHIRHVLTGSAVNTNRGVSRFEFFDFFSSGRRTRAGGRIEEPPRPRDVVIDSIAVSRNPQSSLVETELILSMRNTRPDQAEFVTGIEIPEAVAVSGYWLDVEGTNVSGRIFDRRTALWVYHMIRDRTRRDPGVLHYVGRDTLELRVFPFEPSQTRTCGIRLLYPQGMNPVIRIDGETVGLDVDPAPPRTVLAGGERATGVLLPADTSLPPVTRSRYPHLLLDVSASAVDAIPLYREQITRFLETHPGVDDFQIDLVNYRTLTVGGGRLTRDSWAVEYDQALEQLRADGGFWPERAINHALYLHHRSPAAVAAVPAFTILSRADRSIERNDLIPEAAPDVLVNRPFGSPPVAVHILRCEGELSVVPAGEDSLAVFNARGPVEVYDPAYGWQELSPDIMLLPESRYARFVDLRAAEHVMNSKPAEADGHRDRLLRSSRESGILSDQTAFIVVENSAQWEMLKRKEKESMKADSALAFDEFEESHVTPEPAVWLMITLTVPVLLLARCRGKRHPPSSRGN